MEVDSQLPQAPHSKKLAQVNVLTVQNQVSKKLVQVSTGEQRNVLTVQNQVLAPLDSDRQNTDISTTKQENLTRQQHLAESDIDGVQSFLMFIGWPRSCHSIIGSMLDAHPNMVVAHEYFLFDQLAKNQELVTDRNRLFDALFRNTYKSLQQKGWRASSRDEKGYDLNINGSWQGRFTQLKVIGDKSGGKAVLDYISNSSKFLTLYKQLKRAVKVPIKVLQVVRNPLDMIATATLYRGSSVSGRKADATVKHKYNNTLHVYKSALQTLKLSRAIMRMVPDVGLSPLEVHCEDLIADPAKTVSHICQFLDVECSADYLQMCVDKTFTNVSESRHLVNWDPHTLASLIDTLRTFPFFRQYNLTIDDVYTTV